MAIATAGPPDRSRPRSWPSRKLARIDYRQAGWLHALGKSRRALVWRSLRNPRISRNRRNLQNRNSAAAEIAIRSGPKILLKCSIRETGPKYPTIRIDDGYEYKPVWCTRDPGTSLSTGERAGQFSSVERTGKTLLRQLYSCTST